MVMATGGSGRVLFSFLCISALFSTGGHSLSANSTLSDSLLWAQEQFNMISLRGFTSLAYLSQIAFPGTNAQTNASTLANIVPRRDHFYVGGKYTNVTVVTILPILFRPSELTSRYRT